VLTSGVMGKALDELLALLDLEDLEMNIFRGGSPEEEGRERVFGGLVLAQALASAGRTVEDTARSAHSLHAYFLRPGDPKNSILYDVDRIRDGRSFTTRRVRAVQHGKAIFNMSVSFQVAEKGFEHQFEMPRVPDPNELPGRRDLVDRWAEQIPPVLRQWLRREHAIEERYNGPIGFFKAEKHPPRREIWLRATGRLPDDLQTHQCVLAYASDMTLLDPSTLPHAVSSMEPTILSASLDHAMWFHQPFRADDWLLFVQDSPAAAGARGFSRGSIFTQDGRLVASATQEGLVRRVEPARTQGKRPSESEEPTS